MNPKPNVSYTFLLVLLIISVAVTSASELAKGSPAVAATSSSPPASSANLTQLSAQALLAFKASIVLDPSGVFASWNTSSHFCTWEGVRCSNDSQRVKGLLLNSRQLNGTLPHQLSNLQGLSYLNVSNNSFHGPIPTGLSELALTLTHLDLSANEFSGSIPASLERCTLLRYIDLSSNHLSGPFPSFITNFTLLGFLGVSSNSLTGELPLDMGRLASLQILHVYSTLVMGTIPPSLILNCSKLVWLDLADTLLSGPLPPDWTKLTSLQHLMLTDNRFYGTIPPSLINCTRLSVLYLASNSLTGEIPSSIGAKLTLLQEFVLYMNLFSGPVPPSLMNCTLLVSLELSNNNLSGVIPPDIGRLTCAQWLTFSSNPLIEGTIPSSIGECAQLRVLSLYNTALGGPLPDSLFNLSNLQELKLQNCAFLGSLSASVRQLTSLQLLNLNRNAFEGTIPAEIGELQNLQGLYLQENNFSGSLYPELSGCISIAEMNLSGNPLTGSIPTSFAQLQSLNKLYMRHTRISGPIPDIFGSLTRLQSLDLAYNMMTGSIPASLAELYTISLLLDLSFNNLTGQIPPSLGKMQLLMTMSLRGNGFSGKIPDSLGDCQSMQVLDLSMNRLEGEIPASLGQLKSLQYLDLSENELSGTLPSSLGSLDKYFAYLNVSCNALEGQIPSVGIYENSSSFFFLGNPSLCGYPSSKRCDSQPYSTNHSQRVAIILSAAVAGGVIFAAVLCTCLWWFCHGDNEQEHLDMETPRIRAWKARELRAATNNFDPTNMLGSGAVSVCYKAVMEGSSKGSEKSNLVAVKRLNVENYDGGEARRSFVNELKTICKVRHRNLVKVLGYCVEGGEVALVMECMEEGDLDGHLHGKVGGLDWERRVNVAIDVAEGLMYLHHEYVQPIVHCDLKPKNILLSSDMVAKIADFGIAKLLDLNHTVDMSISKFRGTFGYAAPEYGMGLQISTKVDVYSYGILLLELVTGLRPTSPRLQEEGLSLHTWARSLQETGRTREAFDKNLEADILHEAEMLLCIGVKCSVEAAKERPCMQAVRDIVRNLSRQSLGKKSSPNSKEVLQAPNYALHFLDANKWLLDPYIQVDPFGLQSSSSQATSSN